MQGWRICFTFFKSGRQTECPKVIHVKQFQYYDYDLRYKLRYTDSQSNGLNSGIVSCPIDACGKSGY